MKPSVSKSTRLSVLALAFASFAMASYAQNPTPQFKANIPFGFEYGDQHFAAGAYTINMQSDHIMRIQDGSKSGVLMVLPDIETRPAKDSKLMFHKFGDQYFLREVWAAGNTTHVHSTKSRAEKIAEKVEQASNHAATSGVELALMQPHVD